MNGKITRSRIVTLAGSIALTALLLASTPGTIMASLDDHAATQAAQRPTQTLPGPFSPLAPPALPGPMSPVGSGFTYQGSLANSGNPANGQYDMQFTLFDAATAGNQVGNVVTIGNQTVTNGLFTVTLNFGSSPFRGSTRYLEIAVRATGGGTYTTLSPRQPLTATPYAESLMPGAVVTSTGGTVFSGINTTGAGLYGETNSYYGVYGQSTGSGYGVAGGSVTSVGVFGSSQSNSAVYGGSNSGPGGTFTSNTSDGVQGQTSSDHSGVAGFNLAGGPGVYGQSASGDSVWGKGSVGVGVRGTSDSNTGGYFSSTSANGVEGHSPAANGVAGFSDTGRGMYGTSNSGPGGTFDSTSNDGVQGHTTSTFSGVAGFNLANGPGVYGQSASGDSVWGNGSAGVGVRGTSNSNIGGYFASNSGNGVEGHSPTGDGVAGYSNSNLGVYGESIFGTGGYFTSTNGYGVQGRSPASTGVGGFSDTGRGVFGTSNSGTGGVFTSLNGTGVEGDGNTGVYGYSTIDTGVKGVGLVNGVYGSGGNFGLSGLATGTQDAASVIGSNPSNHCSTCYAGYFDYNVFVVGSIFHGSQAVKMDDPTDPANKYLYQSSVQSPDMLDIYRGHVTLDAQGKAWVQMPSYFQALNMDFDYQLTAIGASQPNLYVAQEIKDNKFQVAGGVAGAKVSWQVTGVRNDPYAQANRTPVEQAKPAEEQGLYLHPELYNQPASKSVSTLYAPDQASTQQQPQSEGK